MTQEKYKEKNVMQNTKEVVPANEYRNLAISVLVESPTNPRKRFDENSLQELAMSFKTHGILEPLLVRPREESKFEVVLGGRRLKAAHVAQLAMVPVRIKEMTDAEALEAQVIENLQREDIHPLEEAMGFRSLLDLKDPKYTMASIAARAGKSEAYVLGRIKLTELIPPVAEAFLKDKIAVGHALLIAKLPASQQQEALNACFRNRWTSEGNTSVLVPVRELAAWIESNILMQLASAPFDKQDETLLPKCGSCVNCPKRTGFNKLLFADVRKDSCKLCGIWFWGWGAGEGGNSPSPAQRYRSAVDRTCCASSILIWFAAGGPIDQYLCHPACTLGSLSRGGSPSTVPRVVDVSIASGARKEHARCIFTRA
jgi:ParB family transcriptional regulator, chromosome partitioning protein